MNPAILIALYVPIFVLFFIILPQQRELQKMTIRKLRKRKGIAVMTNGILKKHIGETCRISTGQFGTDVTGEIIDIQENWIEVETQKGKELINAEFVQSIKIISK